MATFSISNGAMSDVYNHLKSANYGFTEYATGGGTASIKFMSGTPETDFSNLTAPNSLSGQVLWDKSVVANDWTLGDNGGSGVGTPYNQIQLNHQTHSVASSSGTVQWFWYHVDDGSTISFQFLGTVGTSGTDLILPSTSITSGKYYKVTGLNIMFPHEFTY